MRTLTLTVLLLFASNGFAEEAFFLKLEETGYDRLTSESDVPAPQLLRSIELLVKPDEPFAVRLEMSGGLIELTGRLRISDESFRLEWNSGPSKDRDGAPADVFQSIDRRVKLQEFEREIGSVTKQLEHAKSVAKHPESDPAVKRMATNLNVLQSAAHQLRQAVHQQEREDSVTVVQLDLEKPKVMNSVKREVAKGNNLWQKFRRTTTVTLRSGPADRGDAADSIYYRRTRVVPAGLRQDLSIEKGMRFDAIEHELRIKKSIQDKRDLPTTIDRGRLNLRPPIGELRRD